MKTGLTKYLFLAATVLSLGLTAASVGAAEPSAEKLTNTACLECHADNAPKVDQKLFSGSVHQGLNCVDCHKDILALPHPDKLPKVSCAGCHEQEAALWMKSDHGRTASCGSCHGDTHAIINISDPSSPVNRKNIPLTCAECHRKNQETNPVLLKTKETYMNNVHGISFQKGQDTKAAVCSDCHGSHDINKATRKDSKLFWLNIPGTCGNCHKNEYAAYLRGIHGQALISGNRDTPVCTDCHGEHGIDAVRRASSRVSSAHIPETCGQCHAAQRINVKYSLAANVLESYQQSYHGLAASQGSVTAANCASCHGAHDILPSSDEHSSINPKNLKTTCGQCHPGIGAQVSQGRIHASSQTGKNNPANEFVKMFYIFLIFFVSGILLLHNILDFAKKAAVHYRYSLEKGIPAGIMGLNERRQHFVLALTFILLAYTGFCLKFPQAWWALPFFDHNGWLRWGHRGVAILFCALSVYHVYFLLFTEKGRRHLKALSVTGNDLKQFFQMFGYYLGRTRNKPELGPYSYIQKLEYWALVWGSLIMILTGSLMFSEVWFLRLFPKWLYDVVRSVHYYEAILACVAIVIWHGYFVIFDPDVYPGDYSWLHGRHPVKKPDPDRSQKPSV